MKCSHVVISSRDANLTLKAKITGMKPPGVETVALCENANYAEIVRKALQNRDVDLTYAVLAIDSPANVRVFVNG